MCVHMAVWTWCHVLLSIAMVGIAVLVLHVGQRVIIKNKDMPHNTKINVSFAERNSRWHAN